MNLEEKQLIAAALAWEEKNKSQDTINVLPDVKLSESAERLALRKAIEGVIAHRPLVTRLRVLSYALCRDDAAVVCEAASELERLGYSW